MVTHLRLPQKRHSPQFLSHVYCGQTAGWIKKPLSMEVSVGPVYIGLDADSAPPPQKKGHISPISAHVVAKRLDGSNVT